MTIQVPGTNEYVVVLEGELLVFVNLVAKAIAPAFATNVEGGLDIDTSRLRRAPGLEPRRGAVVHRGRDGPRPVWKAESDSIAVAQPRIR